MFGRETLSQQTCLNIINEEPIEATKDFLLEEYQEKVEKSWKKQRNKNIEEALFYKASLENTVKYFQDAMQKIKPLKIKLTKKANHTPTHAYYVCGDLHYGRTTDTLVANFSKMINTVKEKSITLVVLGDLFESPILGGMHDSQNEEMDVIGVDQVLQCMDMLANGIKHLLERGVKVNVIGLTGNHDRVSKNREADPQRIVGVLGYTFLKKLLGDAVQVEFTANKVMQLVKDEGNFILHHGDNNFNSKASMQILNTYGRMDAHNFILSGHWHSAMLESGTNYTRVMCPSLNTASHFEKYQFITKSNPGRVEIRGRDVCFRYITDEE